ncbi:MAG: hypothetical protein ACLFVH_08195 [Phycisphaerae bacterium]
MSNDAYRFETDGTFVIENYHHSAPFSSFLPGLAGLWGIPLWCFYVNRGQGVACFGTRDKDHAIMQFQSANLHHRRVGSEGFRTFLKVSRDGQRRFYEPFRAHQPHYDVSNELRVTFDGLKLRETNQTLGLRVEVSYTPVANEPFAALLRTVTLTNLTETQAEVEWLDGAAAIVPYHVEADLLQRLPFITEAYLRVQDLDARAPFLNLKALPSDTPETEFVEAGHFFFAFAEGDTKLLPAIVDPKPIFGEMLDLARPHAWLAGDEPIDASPDRQETHCLTPCAMVADAFTLPAGEARTLHYAIGKARDLEQARSLPATMRADGWFDAKAAESLREVQKVRHRFFLHGSDAALNQYAPQTFLDNALRGGLPVSLPAGEDGRHVFHVYSRRHGDLERDYNNFLLTPTFFSQGNGAFRDVNQNRRSDVWFNPDVAGENVKFFFELIQPDGFNPMLVKGAQFHVVQADRLVEVLGRHVPGDRVEAVAAFLAKPFSPGELFDFLEDRSIIPADPMGLLRDVLGLSEKLAEAEYEAGYWCDHWYYNFDQLEQFLAIYPDRAEELLIGDRSLTYWDPDVRVRPRDEKYVVYAGGQVRHVDSVAPDKEKAALIAARSELARCVRTFNGTGEVYRTNLLEKILCLLANKAASISPSGIGVEMDGGRPGWHDSINGLPGLFGASTSETFHLLRGLRLLRELAVSIGLGDDYAQPLPVEIAELMRAVRQAAETFEESEEFAYWDRTAAAKEAYRAATRLGFSGATDELTWEQMQRFLDAVERRVSAAVEKAFDTPDGLPTTYVSHEADEWEPLTDDAGEPLRTERGFQRVRITRFSPHRYPLFLEAPTHAIRTRGDADEARAMWRAMRTGPLFDEKLRMYIVGDSVAGESTETGRIWAWPAGWFENENVFLHMEHKYLLSTLQAGLVEEFYEDFRNCFIPFQPVERYGRSPIENTSFIVSSRHPRSSVHGRGYLPRSSGTTAEVLQILLILAFGPQPFAMEDGELTLRFRPRLADWLFTKTPETVEITDLQGNTRTVDLPGGNFSAMFLGDVLVTYVNPSGKSTFGPGAPAVGAMELVGWEGERRTVPADALRGEDALAVRNRQVARIIVTLE